MENSVDIKHNIANSAQVSCKLQSDAVNMKLLCNQANLENYNDFCKSQGITADVKQRGEHYLLELLHLNALNEAKVEQNGLFASVIYIAVVESSSPYGDMDPLLIDKPLELSMTVSEILTKTEININKLFQTMDWIKGQISLSQTVRDHLKKLEMKYLVVSALFHTFEGRLSASVFKEEIISEGTDTEPFLPPLPETEGVSYRKKQCWVLYLLAKQQIFYASQELFQHFQLLLCCLDFVLRQTPSFLLNVPYDSIRFGYYNNHQVTILQKLASDFNVDVDQTVHLQKENTESLFQSLLNADGELDSERLCNDYMISYEKDGDINELDFLLKDSYLLPLQKKSVQQQPTIELSHSIMTPVRMAVCSVQQFQQNFADLKDEPSPKLKTFFKKCTQDPYDIITKNINNLKDKFLSEYQAGGAEEMRFTLGKKLYYKVLEAILINESSHLPAKVLTTLLNKDSFHSSLLACALEVVLITYSQAWVREVHFVHTDDTYSFPWILDVFSLQAYEFYKVIESFIKAEPRLSNDVVKHLQYIEGRVLESLAWSENSVLFEFFTDCDLGQKTPPIAASPVKAPEGSNRNAVDLFLSPVRAQAAPSTSQSSSPIHRPPSSDTTINDIGNKLPSQFKSQSLAHFLKRVLRLGFSRLSRLCNDLEISKELQHKIWTLFEHCVTKKPNLLKNRHIDQIIMCCIYGICKVSENEIKFKIIVNQYKNLPNAKQETFKSVYIEGNRYESVITFYNSVFMVNVRKYILNFHPNQEVKQQLSPMPQSPSYCLAGRKNFLISPLKESFKTPSSPGQMTPATRLLYSFGDSVGSSEKLKDINESVKKFRPVGAKKRLNMDDMEVTPASKVKKTILQ